MFGLLVFAFFAVPLAEIAVIVWVGSYLGIVETLVLMVLVSVVGAWLAKQQGLTAWYTIRTRIDAGELPGAELVDGVLILAAAILLLTPGFVTDGVALGLLFPPVRATLRLWLRRRFARRLEIQIYR